jgi:hypothetical protein
MKPFVDRRGVGLSFFSAETYTCIPLTIAPKLRICIAHSKRFQDRQGVSSLEQVRMRYTDACVSHNRRPKCTTLLPLELHFLASGRLIILLLSYDWPKALLVVRSGGRLI